MQSFEDTLSCLICKDLLDVPEMGSCQHLFCSVCIRRHLTHESKCPVCRQDLHAGGLKRVQVLEIVVDEWRKVRQELKGATVAKDLSQCPVCMKMFPLEELQGKHIETCLKPRRPPPVPKRRAVVNYGVVKDKDLRTLLQNDGLSTEGPRSKLVARHTEWLIQWNANVNRPAPVSAQELRQKMRLWDTAQANLKQKEIDAGQWQTDNSNVYDELCESAFKQLGRSGPRKRSLSQIEADCTVNPMEAVEPAAKKQT